jgi:ATP-dependent DNA helicase RecG
MTRDELLQIIQEAQRLQSETAEIEIKTAAGGTPQRLYEALSAFANRTGGGVLLFGLDEKAGFRVVGVKDAHRLQEEISSLAASGMEPALRPEFTVAEIDGKRVVAVEVEEVPAAQRPCYYRTAGLQKGSYIRVGNTNRLMSDYEIFGYVSARQQPTFDREAVPGTTIDDLDRDAVDAYLDTVQRTRPRTALARDEFEPALVRCSIAADDNGVLRPTLAGLLVFGQYPQQFEGQLVITFLQFFGTREDEPTPRGERFLDNRKFEGALPRIVDDAVDYVLASIRKSSLIEGVFRRDIPEYPEAAIREAIVNAVGHRDYSGYTRGSYVQLRLFADRLEIHSPGGLYGSVTEENIDSEHSTRNWALMRILEDLHVVENRGSGIATMVHAMREANLEPPRFKDRRSSVLVIFKNHTLMGPQTVEWLNQFASVDLNDRQRVALAYLRHNEQIANADYRRLNHVDALQANKELRSMVDAGVAEQHEARRWTYYTLADAGVVARQSSQRRADEEAAILKYVQEHGSITNSECRDLLAIPASRAVYVLGGLVDDGRLVRQGERRWTRYSLPAGL